MEKEMILLSEYCNKSRAELDFISCLEKEGLIDTETLNGNVYLDISQLNDLEMFTRLYYDLSINIEGIDVINNLLSRIRRMEHELSILKRQISNDTFFENDFFDEF